MSEEKLSDNIRNIEITEHINRDKTTLVEGLLKQGKFFHIDEQINEIDMD